MKHALPTITLYAPLSGVVIPLEQVPDAIFAQKMVGDGVAIEPTSQTLVAPCAGTITRLYQTAHAMTITSHEGVEVFIHIGLDTVMLKGEGFDVLVEEGTQVEIGTPLIAFDADKLAMQARSLVTAVLFTQPDLLEHIQIEAAALVTEGEPLLTASPLSAEQKVQQQSHQNASSNWIPLRNPSGLHARPSALFANLAQQFQSEIHLRTATKVANARSVVALMGLNTRPGDLIQIEAEGSDAQAAIDALINAIESGLGEEVVDTSHSNPPEPPLLANISSDPNTLQGVATSPGSAMGRITQLEEVSFDYGEFASDPAKEHLELKQAIAAVRHQLEHLVANKIACNKPEQADIFQLHQELLADPELKNRTRALINQGKSAAFAFSRAITEQAGTLSQLNNPFLACRAIDLRDLRQRVLSHLLEQEEEEFDLPSNSIVVANDLTPSMAAGLDPSKVVGLATTGGGASSHGAILARSMGIPAVVAIDAKAQQLKNGEQVILDGTAGHMRINLSQEQIVELERIQARQARQYKKDEAAATRAAITQDGRHLEVMANIANEAEAQKSLAYGAEGVGLLRTELLFLERNTAPTEAEQAQLYEQIIQAQQGLPVTIRTLDVGGDKPLSYINQPREVNPFLGERGIRMSLNNPGLLRIQLRAILIAAKASAAPIRIMFPMVATLEEFRAAKGLLISEAKRLDVTHYEVGLMVEVPSTALMAAQFATDADFFSIGSNDLTQYTLAMDRNQPNLAARMDSLNPAVLRLIQLTVAGAQQAGKWVCVCGDMASDPQAVPILLGLGVDKLSVAPPVIPVIKRQLRELSYQQNQQLAQQALHCHTAKEVRNLIYS